MTEANQKQLVNPLWSIADQLRGVMDADDFRDNMLSFLFLRYLSNNWFPIRRVCSKAQQQ
jgi:type I restriction enzyme M protein